LAYQAPSTCFGQAAEGLRQLWIIDAGQLRDGRNLD
jgi:hypothetical protein